MFFEVHSSTLSTKKDLALMVVVFWDNMGPILPVYGHDHLTSSQYDTIYIGNFSWIKKHNDLETVFIIYLCIIVIHDTLDTK